MYNVYYEWVSYKDKQTGQDKKFLAYYLMVGNTRISIRGANEDNAKLLDASRKLGLLKKYEKVIVEN